MAWSPRSRSAKLKGKHTAVRIIWADWPNFISEKRWAQERENSIKPVTPTGERTASGRTASGRTRQKPVIDGGQLKPAVNMAVPTWNFSSNIGYQFSVYTVNFEVHTGVNSVKMAVTNKSPDDVGRAEKWTTWTKHHVQNAPKTLAPTSKVKSV